MTTDLERREAKGGKGAVFLLFLALLLPSIGTCGGIGASKAIAAKSSVAGAKLSNIGDEDVVASGAYVRADVPEGSLHLIARDELPIGDNLIVDARGVSVYGIAGERRAVVACADRFCAPLERSHHGILEGRVCPADAPLGCPLTSGLQTYLRTEARQGRAHRVLVVGARPADNVWEAALGLGIAAALVVGLAALMLLVSRRRRAPPITALRQLVARRTRDEVRSALCAQQGVLFRLAEDGPDRLTFLAGIPANRAAAQGIASAERIPRRVEIAFREQAYRPLEVTITVTDIITNATTIGPALQRIVSEAFELTFQQVAHALG